jgi:hypothetical protein
MEVSGTPAAAPAAPIAQPGAVGGGVPGAGVSPAPAPVLPPPVVPPATPGTPPPAQQQGQLPPEYLAALQQSQAQIARLTQQLAAVQGQLPQPAPPAAKPNAFGISPWDASLEQYLQVNDKGEIVEAAGAPPGLAARYQQHRREKAAAIDRLLSDPAAALGPLIQAEAQRIAQQQYAAQAERQTIDTFIAQNGDWLYSGQKVMDYQSGRMIDQLTPLGQQFVQAVGQATQMGIATDVGRMQYAMQALGSAINQARATNQQLTPEQQRMAARMDALMRTPAPSPALPGTQAPPAGYQPPAANGQPQQRRPGQPVTPLMDRMRQYIGRGAA